MTNKNIITVTEAEEKLKGRERGRRTRRAGRQRPLGEAGGGGAVALHLCS